MRRRDPVGLLFLALTATSSPPSATTFHDGAGDRGLKFGGFSASPPAAARSPALDPTSDASSFLNASRRDDARLIVAAHRAPGSPS